MRYLWTEGIPPFPEHPLESSVTADVCVIGGGMAGVLTAAELTRRGADCILLDAATPGMGITKGTTAVLTAQHDQLYHRLAKTYGRNTAAGVLHANLDALRQIRNLAAHIDCDFVTRPSVMYSRTGRDALRREAEFLRVIGFPAVYTTAPGLPFAVVDAVVYPGMAQFHPLKFLRAIAGGLRVYTGTMVRDLKPGAGAVQVITDRGTVTARHAIVATHFPFLNRRGLYFVKQYQRRSYVIAYSGVPDLGCTAEDAGDGFYLRSYGDLLLVGGGTHRTGRRGTGFAAIEDFVRTHFPGAREHCRWANQDCVTLDYVPYIGRYSPALPQVLVATGFCLWGMTTSQVAAGLLADAVEGKPNPYAAFFTPHRSLLHPQLFANLGATLGDFLIPTVRRCPHLGCALRYNRAEHSWDCPCHGSRFDATGHLIDNPATRDAHV